MAPSQPSLPTNRVFVVQFRLPPTEAPAGYDGRGEHLVSGQATRFHSLEGLLAFMIRVLADVQHQAKPREPARGSSGVGTRVETVIMRRAVSPNPTFPTAVWRGGAVPDRW